MIKDLPLLKSHDDQVEKITVYLPKRAADAYRVGKYNGYDTPKIARDAVTSILIAIEDNLSKPFKR